MYLETFNKLIKIREGEKLVGQKNQVALFQGFISNCMDNQATIFLSRECIGFAFLIT
jgi:hypothetical protein